MLEEIDFTVETPCEGFLVRGSASQQRCTDAEVFLLWCTDSCRDVRALCLVCAHRAELVAFFLNQAHRAVCGRCGTPLSSEQVTWFDLEGNEIDGQA